MTAAQRIIKYFALGLAVSLIVAIFSGIVFGGVGLFMAGNMVAGNSNIELTCEEQESCLMVEMSYAELEIRNGDTLAVETTDNVEIETTQNETSLIIKEKDDFGKWFSDGKKIIVHVPKEKEFDKVGISAGAGKIYAEKISVKKMETSLGAGEIVFGSLEAENAKISTGVGSVEVNLASEADKYTVKISRGIGEIKFNGEEVSNDFSTGNGDRKITISDGIGSIKVTSM